MSDYKDFSKQLEPFINQFDLSKTLQFELRPIGKTLENIQQCILEDKERAEDYKIMKGLLDDYHRSFIERTLEGFTLSEQDIKIYTDLLKTTNKDEKTRQKINKLADNLRKSIRKRFEQEKDFDLLFKKEIITDLLEKQKLSPAEEAIRVKFDKFTTYFQGYHQARENIYDKDAKSTAIAHRLIQVNLPKFASNIEAYKKIVQSPLNETIRKYLTETGIENAAELFENISSYNTVLTQKGIDQYNALLGREMDDTQAKGINQLINEYNQQQTQHKLPKLTFLHKQILSIDLKRPYKKDFENTQELMDEIEAAYQGMQPSIGIIKERLESIKNYDTSRIYIRSKDLNELSTKLTGSWQSLEYAIKAELKQQYKPSKKTTTQKIEEKIDKLFKTQKSFSIKYLEQILSTIVREENEVWPKTITDYFKSGRHKLSSEGSIYTNISDSYSNFNSTLKNETGSNGGYKLSSPGAIAVKNLLDNLLSLSRFAKMIEPLEDENNKDLSFYGEFENATKELSQIIPLYNKARNFVSRKPYSLEKYKLNFQEAQLLSGWDQNKENDFLGTIFRRDSLFFLCLTRKGIKNLFSQVSYRGISQEDNKDAEAPYEKMIYKQIPSARMLSKVFFSKKWIAGTHPPSQDIMRIKQNETFKHSDRDNDKFNLRDCHAMIDYYKDCIAKHPDWRKAFDFTFTKTQKYQDINEFYKEVEDQAYRVKFEKIPADYINQLIDEGKIFFFQIYNKDFSPHSKGKPNLHTLYWRTLFAKENLDEGGTLRLSGGAEIFFRERSLGQCKPTHPKGQPIPMKSAERSKETRTLEYDLYKNRRFMSDKIQVHIPIKLNAKAAKNNKLNAAVLDYIRSHPGTHIIGIDRGERHLLYVSVIDANGKIVEQHSLNQIVSRYNGKEYTVDYNQLLQKRSTQMLQARKDWQKIENIKELKHGYMSQVVRYIADLMIRYNAILVMEDLNIGFMRRRQKVEKQVYQKFEKALIDKLSFLASKEGELTSPGGLLKAYQLSFPVGDGKRFKHQGFVFYVNPQYTSQIDPTTGFVNFFYAKYSNISAAQEFFKAFESIHFNKEAGYYEFSFDYNNFTDRARLSRQKWTACTYGSRIAASKIPTEGWNYEEINLTEEFSKLFGKYDIDIEQENLCESIIAVDSKEFFQSLLHLFQLTVQLRNSSHVSGEDYIISPIKNSEDTFFDSRKPSGNGSVSRLPIDADANGAYNIARKGILLVNKIKQTSTDAKQIDLSIGNNEWFEFIQKESPAE